MQSIPINYTTQKSIQKLSNTNTKELSNSDVLQTQDLIAWIPSLFSLCFYIVNQIHRFWIEFDKSEALPRASYVPVGTHGTQAFYVM